MCENNFEIWEKIFRSREWGKYPPLELVRFVARNFYSAPDKSAIKILEIGCGAGANLWYLAREGFTVYGIDGSQTACDISINRLREENLSHRIGQIEVGDYFNELDNFENQFFDAVIDIASLGCNSFRKSKEILQKVFSKLKIGGKLFSHAIADGTWGLDRCEIDYHACYPVEGPLANEGFNRFTSRDDIMQLYQQDNSQLTNIARQELQLEGGKFINHWLIEAVRTTA